MQILRKDIRIIAIVVAGIVAIAGIVTLCEVRRAQRMRAAVEQALEQNRSGVPFTSDTVSFTLHSSFFTFHSSSAQRVSLRRAVAYYDHPFRRLWTSPNDRLRAGYALGCVYRDLHEAPIALLTWEDAIAAADTTSADCDYATLYRVYGQMAEVYFRQYMPEKELEAEQQFCHFALLAGDTLNYIRGQLLRNDAYLALGDTAAVFDNIEHVRQLYLKRGLTQEAAQVYPSAIHIAVDRGEYEKADSMMQIFEKESGLFDENGNIAPTREIYYYHKGAYFLGTHLLDSAEVLFRRLLKYEPNLLDAYRGLVLLYQHKGNKDSLRKHTVLYEEKLADYLEDTQTNAIVHAQGMYDYNRQQMIAEKRKEEATRRGRIILFLLFLGGVSYWYVWRITKKREIELHNTTHSYLQALQEIERLNQDISFLTSHAKEESKVLLQEKEERIDQLEDLIERYKEKLGQALPSNDNEALMKSGIVQLLRDISHLRSYKENGTSIIKVIDSRACENEEWQALIDAIKRYHYSFYYLITTEKKLPKLQYKICVLSRLGFTTNEIATLLGTSEQNVSNARRRAVKRLFDSNDTALLESLLPKS